MTPASLATLTTRTPLTASSVTSPADSSPTPPPATSTATSATSAAAAASCIDAGLVSSDFHAKLFEFAARLGSSDSMLPNGPSFMNRFIIAVEALGIPWQALPKYSTIRLSCLYVFFVTVRPLWPNAFSSYEEAVDFSRINVKAESGLFDCDAQERQSLTLFANWCKLVLNYIPAKGNKQLYMYLIPMLSEGPRSKYVTGGGATPPTKRRMILFDKLSGIAPGQRDYKRGAKDNYHVKKSLKRIRKAPDLHSVSEEPEDSALATFGTGGSYWRVFRSPFVHESLHIPVGGLPPYADTARGCLPCETPVNESLGQNSLVSERASKSPIFPTSNHRFIDEPPPAVETSSQKSSNTVSQYECMSESQILPAKSSEASYSEARLQRDPSKFTDKISKVVSNKSPQHSYALNPSRPMDTSANSSEPNTISSETMQELLKEASLSLLMLRYERQGSA